MIFLKPLLACEILGTCYLFTCITTIDGYIQTVALAVSLERHLMRHQMYKNIPVCTRSAQWHLDVVSKAGHIATSAFFSLFS